MECPGEAGDSAGPSAGAAGSSSTQLQGTVMTVRGVSSSTETWLVLGSPPTTTPAAPAGIQVVCGLAMGIRSCTRMPTWMRLGARQRGMAAETPRSPAGTRTAAGSPEGPSPAR